MYNKQRFVYRLLLKDRTKEHPMTDYGKDFVKEFSRRTFENLKMVCDNKDKDGKPDYEVTQLLNSFIGLLIFPKEGPFSYKRRQDINFPNSEIQKIAEDSNCRKGNGDCHGDYFCMIRHLRNAIAHKRIEVVSKGVIAEQESIIEGVRFCDRQVCFYLRVTHIYTILMSVFSLILEKDFPVDEAKLYAKYFQ